MSKKKERVYGMAPLPFQGQKRKWKSDFVNVIKTLPDDTIVVDLFGGSGLLSHFSKTANPKLRVIWNDYDDYQSRLRAIPKTNELVHKMKAIIGDEPRGKRLPKDKEEAIRTLLRESEEREEFVDFLTISRSIVFSSRAIGSTEELISQTYYNRVVMNDYNCDGYLEGVEVVRCDYKDLVDKYQDDPRVVFLADPPYLNTDTSSYNMVSQSGLSWNIELLNNIIDKRFIFFTSERSDILSLMNEIGKFDIHKNAEVYKRSCTLGANRANRYNELKKMTMEDIMIVRITHDKGKKQGGTKRQGMRSRLCAFFLRLRGSLQLGGIN